MHPPNPPPPREQGQSKAMAEPQLKAQAKAKARTIVVASSRRSADIFAKRLRFKDGYAEVKGLLQVVPDGNDTKSSDWSCKTKARHF